MIACAVTDLPDPDSPRMASVSPSLKVERHAVDRLGDAVAGAELHLQLVDLEQQAVVGLARCRGVEESRRRALRWFPLMTSLRLLSAVSDRGRRGRTSPSMMNASTVSDKKTLGKSSMCGAARISPIPEASEIWMPQEMAGGCSPMPRKDRVASTEM